MLAAPVLVGMMFEKVEAIYDENGKRSLVPTGEPEVFYPADDVLIAVGQENTFRGSSGTSASISTNGKCRWSTKRLSNPRIRKFSLAATRLSALKMSSLP